MSDLYYICKYTPLELLEAFGANCICLDAMPEGFDHADEIAHPNLCGFGKSVLEAVLAGNVKELVLVNCCDSIKSVYDLLMESGRLDFLYMLDMLHFVDNCSVEQTASRLKELAKTYGAYTGRAFDLDAFSLGFKPKKRDFSPHVAVMGARMGKELYEMASRIMPFPVINETCVHNRSVGDVIPTQDMDFDSLMNWYAGELLGQLPCMRMIDNSKRKELIEDPSLKAIIYHTVKFCDFYSFEYTAIKDRVDVPLLKIESDYTLQSSGQLQTRLEAFAENLDEHHEATKRKTHMNKGYFAGIDSGSASTDVVILNNEKEIVADVILPTGAGARTGASRALEQALNIAGIKREDIESIVSTGYGRSSIDNKDKSITEITCHARGAHFLDSSVRTVIDIGGQDSKVIRLNADGSVSNFVMNDKCAAGTGRFLEMMAKTMEMSLDEMSRAGLSFNEDITISSVCTVFAESELVSLIALNKRTDDIVHGLDKAVAAKTLSLIKRVGGEGPYMMTGGVALNKGLVKTLEERLGARIVISDRAQVCGALGAALFAMEMAG